MEFSAWVFMTARFRSVPADPCKRAPSTSRRGYGGTLSGISSAILSPGQIMGSNSRIAGGFNYGGGITYRLKYMDSAKLFMEFRYHRAYQRDGKTIVVPVTLGLRW